MSEVAIRDTYLASVDVWHETDENGQPACRKGQDPAADYCTEDVEELPDHITKCDYCAGEHTARSSFRPGTAAYELDQADAEEVPGQ